MSTVNGRDVVIGCLVTETDVVVRVVDLWEAGPNGPGTCLIEISHTPERHTGLLLNKEQANQLAAILRHWEPME